MTIHTPDNWVILEIEGDDGTFYRVLGGWSGSYLYGSSWRLNSGITKIIEKDEYYEILGESGSTYHCHKDMEELKMNNVGIYNRLKEHYGDKVNRVFVDEVVLS